MPALVTDDDSLGRILKPNTDILLVNEGFYMGRVNQGGYLGPYFPESKPDRVIRIALVGDSYVAGFQVFDRHHFRTIMQERLQRLVPDSVQVLNFGFAGFNLERMYIYYKRRIATVRPDYVLFFIGMDDLTESDKKIGPFCTLQDGRLLIDDTFRDSPDYQRIKALHRIRDTAFYSLHKKALEMYLAGQTPRILFDKMAFLFSPVTVSAPQDTVMTVPSDRLALAQKILRELAQVKDPRVILVVKNRLSEGMVRFIAAQNLPLFNPAGALDSLRTAGIDPNYWKSSSRSGHWNHHAHRAIGNYLASEMRKMMQE